MLDKEISSSDRMKELLLAQFEEAPVINAILESVGIELDRIYMMLHILNTRIYPDTATGHALDMCGEVAGIDRELINIEPDDFFGFPDHGGFTFGEAPFRKLYENLYKNRKPFDNEYRALIKAKIAKNITDGSRQSSVESLKKVFNVDDITVSNAGNAKANIGIGRMLSKNEIRLMRATDLAVHGAGIGIDYFYRYESKKTFGFTRSGINYNNFYGLHKKFSGGCNLDYDKICDSTECKGGIFARLIEA